ncbi:hypothetical protein E8E13_002790 [Curvularia kusanoi]|uniref:NACHT domain-containing protein n=1 Tax=Curvularia kusanoi TaxID=90978 RepID=A0A9P4T4U9_CURKU|nr:hypothetical protein E8E13_002790 [Curvularia kusanoi]
MGRKRDLVRAWLKPDSASPVVSPTPPRGSSPAPPPPVSSPPASNAASPVTKTSKYSVLDKAFTKASEKVPETEKVAFVQASKTIDEKNLLTRVRAYDAAHKDTSSFRPHADRLSKFLDLLNRFMGGVAIGIQASPEISSLVVGSVRIVIDLALRFSLYFVKLTNMICEFEEYLSLLEQYAKAADIAIVERTVVNAYATLIEFSWKARRLFIDAAGNERKRISFRVFMRQHWEPFESEFVTIKEDLQRHFNELSHCVQALHFDFARKAELARRQAEAKKERSEFLNWLSSVDFEKTHQDTFAKKHEDTCDWLIQQVKYKEWLNTPASSLLWCHGKPGIGKSVLASNVIEDITLRVGLREDAALCFAYYNYQNVQLKDLHQVVGSLIKQVCRRKNSVPRSLLQIKEDAFSSSLVGTQDIFLSLTEDLSEVYVVFDALDECPEQERGEVLQFITGIMTAQGQCKIRVFVTSREEMDIKHAFADKSFPSIHILAESVTADIETYTRSQVEKLWAGVNGKTLYINNDELQEKIIQTLASKAAGMFLWVNLQLDSLCQASKAHQDAVVEAALESLPQGLSNTYARILDKVEAQTPYMRELALMCLSWTIYAERPLTIDELRAALTINLRHESRQDLHIDSSQVILEACGNLLEKVGNFIRPIHYTVQEYMTTAIKGPLPHTIRAQLLDSRAVHIDLSLACLFLIRKFAFRTSSRHHSLIYEFDQFADYAFQTFDCHIAQCGEPSVEIMSELDTIMQQNSAFLAYIVRRRVRDFNPAKIMVTPGTLVYSSHLYHVPSVRQKWCDGTSPKYALHLAASARLPTAVIRLLQAGYDVNEKDSYGQTPLYFACMGSAVETAQILIHHQADINVQGGQYGSPLQAASVVGSEQLVKLLLDNNADVNTQPEHGFCGQALQAASFWGHKEVVKMLLAAGADVNARGGCYGSALHAASFWGDEEIINILIASGADVHARGESCGSVLLGASACGHEQVIKLLLAAGADVNVQGGRYRNALNQASSAGRWEVVKILVANGAHVNAVDEKHGSALMVASGSGHEQVVRILLAAGADVNVQGGEYGSALHVASLWGKEAIVKMLIASGADVNADAKVAVREINLKEEKHCFGSALLLASYRGHEQVVQILLDAGADVNARGVDVNAKDGSSYGALWVASDRGHQQVVQILLAAGAQDDRRLGDGQSSSGDWETETSSDSWSSASDEEAF